MWQLKQANHINGNKNFGRTIAQKEREGQDASSPFPAAR
jgi:hypothetical protein